MNPTKSFLFLGHGCLDITVPIATHGVTHGLSGSLPVFSPGKLIRTSAARIAFGGSVPNTGAASCILGNQNVVGLFALSDDEFGVLLLKQLRSVTGPAFTQHLVPLAGAERSDGDSGTSYSIIISPEGVDRTIFHCVGVNRLFNVDVIPPHLIDEADVVHFGYPPLLQSLCLADEGLHFSVFLRDAKAKSNVTTSLDMTSPDCALLVQEASVRWDKFLACVLPHVDVFTPSMEEIVDCLSPFHPGLAFPVPSAAAAGSSQNDALVAMAVRVADVLLSYGTKIVLLKLGRYGALLKSCDNLDGIGTGFLGGLTTEAAHAKCQSWRNRTLFAPSFRVDCVGTTGAGDCTIAAFLSCLAGDSTVAQIAQMAFAGDGEPEGTTARSHENCCWVDPSLSLALSCAAGACNVEEHDSFSGLRPIADIVRRIASGWPRQQFVATSPLLTNSDQCGNFSISTFVS